MAFKSQSNTNKNSNQFVARYVSKKTGDTANWINLTEGFAKKVFGTELKNVTYAEAVAKLPDYYESKYLQLEITDLTATLEVIDPTEF